MLSSEARQALEYWQGTGILTTDNFTVMELREVFAKVEDATMGIPEYNICRRHATEMKHKLDDIIQARREKQ